MRDAQYIHTADWIPPRPLGDPKAKPVGDPKAKPAKGQQSLTLIREASLAASLAVVLSWGLGELTLLLLG